MRELKEDKLNYKNAAIAAWIVVLYTICSLFFTIILIKSMSQDGFINTEALLEDPKIVFYSVLIISPLSTFVTLTLYKKNRKFSDVLMFDSKITWKQLLKTFGCSLIPLIASIVVGLLIKDKSVSNETTKSILSMSIYSKILTAVLVAPVAEEIVFRGMIFDAFKKDADTWLYPIMSGLLFGAMHTQQGGILEVIVPMIVTGTAGMTWARLYQKEQNLYLTMFAHMVYNGIVVLISVI